MSYSAFKNELRDRFHKQLIKIVLLPRSFKMGSAVIHKKKASYYSPPDGKNNGADMVRERGKNLRSLQF